MSDLIDRQLAIDTLMAWEEDSIWDEECLKHRGEPFWISPSDVVENLPSAEPEIIYCKDCEWWEKQKDSLQGRCALMQMYPTGGWFCGNAQERRTDDKTNKGSSD